MPKDLWTQAYVRGYYYGRCGREQIAEVDHCYSQLAAFAEGLAAGRKDFQEIDLLQQAERADHAEPESLDSRVDSDFAHNDH